MATHTADAQQKLVEKPRLSVLQIFTMSFGFLGIQFGFALQNGNTSRILRSFGADVDQLPAFWLVAPLTGMIVQPLIGHYSDRTWNRLGRRKPYFLTGAVLTCIALLILPNSGSFSSLIPALWIGAGLSCTGGRQPSRQTKDTGIQYTNFPDRTRGCMRILFTRMDGQTWVQLAGRQEWCGG
jgi:MFS family permease